MGFFATLFGSKHSSQGRDSQCKVAFDANGKVQSIEVTEGRWVLEQKGQSKYFTQKARSLLQAVELLKQIRSIPPVTYYIVETPDGALGRDIQGYYTEAPLKTENLTIESASVKSEAVKALSLKGFGDEAASLKGVAIIKQQGGYSRLVLLMECGKCGYSSPVETQAGPFVRECYCCGVKNNSHRGTVSVFLGSTKVEI